MDITRQLAAFIVESRFDALPSEVRHEGVRAFVNWMGCVVGGSRETVVERVLSVYQQFSGLPQSTVIGWGKRVDMPTAALVNTISAFVHSYNDTHLATVAHPNSAPASALFALSEQQKMSGTDCVHGLILGTEAAIRAANVLAAPPASCHVGLSVHGVTDVIAAAVAVGKLLGLDAQHMDWALGHAVVQAAGVRNGHGSMATKLIGGHGARCGVMAAYLAAGEFTSSPQPIEGSKGYGAVFANPANPAALVDRLGQHYEIMVNTYKPFPTGIVNHAAVDACLRVTSQEGFDAEAIDEIRLRVHPLTAKLGDLPQPQDRMQAIVSVQHWAAASLLFAKAGLVEASNACVGRADVAALRQRVVVIADDSLAADAAAVTVRLKDGREFKAEIAHCRGSLDNPMSDDDLSEKFRGQVNLMLPSDRTEELLALCWRVEELDDVGSLAKRFFSEPLPTR